MTIRPARVWKLFAIPIALSICGAADGTTSGTVTAPRMRSNEIEAIIDCSARTISILELITYSGRAATGDMGFGFVSTAAERRPERIDMRKGSTSGYLYRHLCKRR